MFWSIPSFDYTANLKFQYDGELRFVFRFIKCAMERLEDLENVVRRGNKVRGTRENKIQGTNKIEIPDSENMKYRVARF